MPTWPQTRNIFRPNASVMNPVNRAAPTCPGREIYIAILSLGTVVHILYPSLWIHCEKLAWPLLEMNFRIFKGHVIFTLFFRSKDILWYSSPCTFFITRFILASTVALIDDLWASWSMWHFCRYWVLLQTESSEFSPSFDRMQFKKY